MRHKIIGLIFFVLLLIIVISTASTVETISQNNSEDTNATELDTTTPTTTESTDFENEYIDEDPSETLYKNSVQAVLEGLAFEPDHEAVYMAGISALKVIQKGQAAFTKAQKKIKEWRVKVKRLKLHLAKVDASRKDCPLKIRGAILNTKIPTATAKLTFLNTSQKEVASFDFHIFSFDAKGKPFPSQFDYRYPVNVSDLIAPKGFLTEIVVLDENREAKIVKVVVWRVVFEDETKWLGY